MEPIETDRLQQDPAHPRETDKPAEHPVTHNLDTGKDEPLQDTTDPEDKVSIMDFADGSGGGSATSGGAA